MNSRPYKYSTAWEKSMDLNVEVHELIENLPRKGTQIFADMLSRFASDVVIYSAHSEESSDE